MQKTLLPFIYFLYPFIVPAQSAFLVLKKNHKTIETFFSGSYINCKTDKGEWLNARINNIAYDTLYLKPFELIRFINAWGMPASDTLWGHERKLAVKNIAAFPRRDQSVNYIKNGGILIIGSAGYIILNVVNTLSSGDALFDDNNGVRLGIAAAIFAVGMLIHHSHSDELSLGRRYRLVYIRP
jgi:hypothetical protein